MTSDVRLIAAVGRSGQIGGRTVGFLVARDR